jgi:hypothetical protein
MAATQQLGAITAAPERRLHEALCPSSRYMGGSDATFHDDGPVGKTLYGFKQSGRQLRLVLTDSIPAQLHALLSLVYSCIFAYALHDAVCLVIAVYVDGILRSSFLHAQSDMLACAIT